MTYLKIKKSILLIFTAVMIAGSIKAQIATPQGEIQGGNRADTARFVDKPSMHVHEETTVTEIKKAGKGKSSKGVGPNGGHNAQPVDSPQQANNNVSNTSTPSTADTIGGMNRSEGSGNVDMNSMNSTPIVANNQNKTPLYSALTAFGIGALIGLFLLVMILRGNKTSKLMALVHGAFGLVGIGMLIVYAMFYSGLVVSLVILAIAATGGIIVFYKDINNEPIPKWLAVTHGVVAVAGIITLIVFAIQCG
jgi:hypothetical protein